MRLYLHILNSFRLVVLHMSSSFYFSPSVSYVCVISMNIIIALCEQCSPTTIPKLCSVFRCLKNKQISLIWHLPPNLSLIYFIDWRIKYQMNIRSPHLHTPNIHLIEINSKLFPFDFSFVSISAHNIHAAWTCPTHLANARKQWNSSRVGFFFLARILIILSIMLTNNRFRMPMLAFSDIRHIIGMVFVAASSLQQYDGHWAWTWMVRQI